MQEDVGAFSGEEARPERKSDQCRPVIADYDTYQDCCTTLEEEENEAKLKRLRACKGVIEQHLAKNISDIADITDIIREHEVTSRMGVTA